MINYTLKKLTTAEFNDLVLLTTDKCRQALQTKLKDKKLIDYLQAKYEPAGTDVDDIVKELLYTLFSKFGESKGIDNYANAVYCYCMGILVVDRFLTKLATPHDSFSVYIKSYEPDIDNDNEFRFEFDINAADAKTHDAATFAMSVSLVININEWQDALVDFVSYSRGFAIGTSVGKILEGFKEFWDRAKKRF